MPDYKRINATEANALLENSNYLLDIRDIHSFNSSHITTALHIDQTSLDDFLARAEKEIPVIIYCYHGNSSQSAAAFFCEQGFKTVFSLDGGFEMWKLNFPTES